LQRHAGAAHVREMPRMESVRLSPLWLMLLGASILCDVVATAYLKWAGDRFSDTFLLANVASILIFAPAIVTFGYALREGPSYLVTTLVWLVGLTLGNTLVGVMVFGDPFGVAKAAGLGAAVVALVLLTI
jgi:multidrug transporter EmrE-like cation transporter